jgi:hypothetical protein
VEADIGFGTIKGHFNVPVCLEAEQSGYFKKVIA